jgi:dTMP kinase
MKEEKEKLLVEMERRRALLGEAREHTGVNAYQRELEEKARAEEARREEEYAARRRLEEETLRERERRQLESRENREVRAREREELEAERMQRLEYERRTMVAELEAERARFELEKRAFQEGVSTSQASMAAAAGGAGAGGGAGMDPTGVAALEQIRAAVEAERKAQEAMLMAEQARMADIMQRERRELEQRLAEEKAALEVRDRHHTGHHTEQAAGQSPVHTSVLRGRKPCLAQG